METAAGALAAVLDSHGSERVRSLIVMSSAPNAPHVSTFYEYSRTAMQRAWVLKRQVESPMCPKYGQAREPDHIMPLSA